MKKSKAKLVLEGKIIERLPTTFFEVELDNGQTMLTYLATKRARKYYLQLKPGDRVQVELLASDASHGKIVRVLEPFDPSIILEMMPGLSSSEEIDAQNKS